MALARLTLPLEEDAHAPDEMLRTRSCDRSSVVVCLGKVFVTTNNSWQASGGAAGDQKVSGGGDADTAEVIKLFRERCSSVTVNMRLDKADYIVLARDDGSGALRNGRKIVVSNPDGDVILTKADRSFGGTVKDACKAIAADWSAKSNSPSK
jgi:hypothetical protein